MHELVDHMIGPAALRERVIATARAMNVANINRGKSGNVSARWREASFDGFVVTPTGVPYDALVLEDVAAVALDGSAHGAKAPSSEWRFHRDIYRTRPEIGAIVHAHSPYATALACNERGIPPFHYMVAIAGGKDVRCAPYATFGTQALSDRALAALAGRTACLLAHHGLIALGSSPEAALARAIEVEALAEIYTHALAIGEPPLLGDAEMAIVIEKFQTYGQPGGERSSQ